jgi:hypothetical protein
MWRPYTCIITLALVLGSSGANRSDAETAYPVRVSDNHHFLIDQKGEPFFYLGDTAWELFHRLDRDEADVYLKDRAAKRFTVIQAVVLAEHGGLDVPNAYGHLPLVGKDVTRPVEAYFKYVDFVVDRAEALGLIIGMLPTWGSWWHDGPGIFTPETAETCGEYVGRRYRNKPIIWILGGDRAIENDRQREIIRAMARGLRKGDGGRHVMTFHPPGGRGSSEWFQGEDWLVFNMIQSGHGYNHANYAKINADYAREPAKPCIDGEPGYEDHPAEFNPKNGYLNDYETRKFAYWSLFAGACGHTYGCHDIWQFLDPRRSPITAARTPWRTAKDLPGASQMQFARVLLESRPVLARIPDQSVLASDPGQGTDHVQATRAGDGSYAFVYSASGQPFTVNLEKLSGTRLHASWYDPRSGKTTAIATFQRVGRKEFQPPSRGEGRDWVLILDDEARGYLDPGTTRRSETKQRPLHYTTSWLGNTFGGGPRWVQNAAESMQVLGDGSLVVGSFWDEGGREVGLYKEGEIVGQLSDTHMRAGYSVAANARYLFYAHTCALEDQPAAKAGEALDQKPVCYFGASRYNRDGTHAPFSGGKTRFKNMLSFRQGPDNHALIPRGIAANEKLLFVADTAFDTIKVLDVGTMRILREFRVSRPGRLAVDADGDLWVICDNAKRVASYSADGALKVEALPLPADVVPSGLGFDHRGRLLVCDNGPRQQVHAFDIKQRPPTLTESLGEEGGMFGGPEPGKSGPWRFAGPTGAGSDAAGNLYVSCNVPRGGTVLRAFSLRRTLLWELLGLEFVDVADADPASDGRDVFTADDRYRFDPDAPPGKNWRWEAHTLDPRRYPHDLRPRFPGLQCGTSVRTLGGERFLCQRGMWQGLLGLYRIDGDLAVPSAVLSSGPIKTDDGWSPPGQPDTGRWIWRDADGDGQMESGEYASTTGPDGEYWASNVDSAGDIWQAGRESGIWRWRFLGLDGHRNPRYDSKPEHCPMPAPFSDLLRTEYLPGTDTMYLSGQTKDRPISHGEWGTAGTVVVRYDEWSKRPRLRYRIDLPYIGDKQFIVSIAYAGELAFAVDCKSAEVFVYKLDDGLLVGSMKPGREVHSESGWVDFRDGIRALRRKDGNYLVFVEEDFKGKSLVYHLEDPLKKPN